MLISAVSPVVRALCGACHARQNRNCIHFSGGDRLLAEAAPDGTVTTVNIWGQQGLLGRYDPAHPDGVVYYLPDPPALFAQRIMALACGA